MGNGNVVVRIEGGEVLLRRLHELGVNVQDVLEAATVAGAELVREAAEGRAPGPHVERETVRRSQERCEVDVGPDKEHWYYRFAETGARAHGISGDPLVFEGSSGLVVTRHVDHPGTPQRPFLRPAMDGNEGEVEKRMGDHFLGAVEKVCE